jgi:hypothetical protein
MYGVAMTIDSMLSVLKFTKLMSKNIHVQLKINLKCLQCQHLFHCGMSSYEFSLLKFLSPSLQ